MPEDPIRKYSSLCEEFEAAYKRIRDFGDVTQEVARRLNNKPHVFMISNVSVGFPIELSLSPKVFSLDGNRWPSAKDIAEAHLDSTAPPCRQKEAHLEAHRCRKGTRRLALERLRTLALSASEVRSVTFRRIASDTTKARLCDYDSA